MRREKMNEVTKRLQERQTPKLKEGKFISLCLVDAADNTYPVVIPDYGIAVGDLVWFLDPELMKFPRGVIQGEVKFVGRCEVKSDLWNGIEMATGIKPINCIKYAHPVEAEWGD